MLNNLFKINSKLRLITFVLVTIFIQYFLIVQRFDRSMSLLTYYFLIIFSNSESLKSINSLKLNSKIIYYFLLIIFLLNLNYYLNLYFFDEFLNDSLYSFSSLIKGLIVLPILEELLFRNIILKEILKNYNNIQAIFIVSLIFSICHIFTDTSLAYAFVLSFIISIYYIKNDSQTGHIYLHIFNNIGAFFLSHILAFFK